MMLLPSRDEIFYPLPESGFAMLDLAISSGELRSCEQIPPKTFGAAAFLAILTTQRKGKYLDEIEKRRVNLKQALARFGKNIDILRQDTPRVAEYLGLATNGMQGRHVLEKSLEKIENDLHDAVFAGHCKLAWRKNRERGYDNIMSVLGNGYGHPLGTKQDQKGRLDTIRRKVKRYRPTTYLAEGLIMACIDCFGCVPTSTELMLNPVWLPDALNIAAILLARDLEEICYRAPTQKMKGPKFDLSELVYIRLEPTPF
ncbi:hypothetical protein [Aeromonas salmonicida]|uniref:hypothetical protein n=1 Tax=Aeromonas salmonicida TaxID=645 RepID=UPI000C1B86C7|nr:hypothetical protein [Aeromonas salmonicida]ATU99124.1 hypothetical protein CHQ57_18050 [Aeromonas salmonicida]